jgi:GTP cyclohydrolase I
MISWIASRPQIQEECAVQIADLLEHKMHPQGLAVVIKAAHTCMTWRGVKDSQSSMVTSVMRGVFRNDSTARNEFLEMIKNG